MKKHAILLCTVLLLILIVGGSLGFKPLYQRFKVYRASTLSAEIAENFGLWDWRTTIAKIITAETLNPNDLSIQRLKGRILTIRKHPRSMEVWVKLVQTEPRNPENWEGLFHASMESRDPRMAAMAIEGFRKSAAAEETHLVDQFGFQLGSLMKDREKTMEFAQRILADSRHSDAFLVSVYRFMRTAPDSESRRLASQWLMEQGRKDSPQGLYALVAWAKHPPAGKEHRSWLIERLRTHPEAGLNEQILATSVEIDARSTAGESLQQWAEFASERAIQERVEIASFLNALYPNDQVFAAILSEEDIYLHRDVALMKIDQLGHAREWDSLTQLLNDPKLPILGSLRSLYLARAAREQDREKSFQIHWNRALEEARSTPASLGYLANYADAMGWNEEAIAVCETMTQFPETRIEGWLALYRIAVKTGDEDLRKSAAGQL